MAQRPSTTRARVAEVMGRLHVMVEMTIGEYFQYIDKTSLGEHELEALEKHGRTILHDFMVEETYSRNVRDDFEYLAELPRKPNNHLELLRQLYQEALEA